jgi:hypothetical protein
MTPQVQTWPGLDQFESFDKPLPSLCGRLDLLGGFAGAGLGVCPNGVVMPEYDAVVSCLSLIIA